MADKSAFEFDQTQSFVDGLQNICGPYEWERLDLLVLPANFSYGGMENPNMIFLTPTLLAGDRSLANVMLHEIAHSWSGNLVTMASW